MNPLIVSLTFISLEIGAYYMKHLKIFAVVLRKKKKKKIHGVSLHLFVDKPESKCKVSPSLIIIGSWMTIQKLSV